MKTTSTSSCALKDMQILGLSHQNPPQIVSYNPYFKHSKAAHVGNLWGSGVQAKWVWKHAPARAGLLFYEVLGVLPVTPQPDHRLSPFSLLCYSCVPFPCSTSEYRSFGCVWWLPKSVHPTQESCSHFALNTKSTRYWISRSWQ